MAEAPTNSVGDLLAELKNNYAAEIGNKIDDIELHILKLNLAANFQEAVRQIHSMKGTAGTYGFMSLSTICHHMEDELSVVTPAECNSRFIDKMLSYIDLLRRVERTIASGTPADTDLDEELNKLRGPRQVFHVMLVEGSKTLSALIRDTLPVNNIELKCMEDGYMALGVMLMQPYDILIASDEIGRLNGRALINAIKTSTPAGHTLKTILLSSKSSQADIMASSADYYIAKNADLSNKLRKLMQSLLKSGS